MADILERKGDEGERVADASVRFSNHPANTPMYGIMEIIHNIASYAKPNSRATMEIQPCGGGMCNYHFYNKADIDKLPTFDRLKEIASTAGSSISSGEGVSICGIGTEVMALRCRPYAKSVVVTQINVIRNGETYGTIITFDGDKRKISFKMIKPIECFAEDSYDVVFSGCKMIKDEKITKLKRKIVDTIPDNGLEILLLNDKDVCTLSHVDFLYRKELVGTNNYEKHVFHLESGEEIVLEIADVNSIVKSKKGNKNYEFGSKLLPELSGGAFRYKGIATVCRDWKFANLSVHSTRHNVRFDISVSGGDYIFKHLHGESQVKTKACMTIGEIVNEFHEPLKMYDENGEEHEIGYLSKLINDFYNRHETDGDTAERVEEATSSISRNIVLGNLDLKDINTTIDVLVNNISGKVKVSTAIKKILIPMRDRVENNSFIKELAYSGTE